MKKIAILKETLFLLLDSRFSSILLTSAIVDGFHTDLSTRRRGVGFLATSSTPDRKDARKR